MKLDENEVGKKTIEHLSDKQPNALIMLQTPFRMRTLRVEESRHFSKTLTHGQTYAHATIVIQSPKVKRYTLRLFGGVREG